MKLKFYLRGIGLGIIVTALVLHFTLASSDSAMSDEQIKQRAMELGMIENTVLKASAASENEAGEISAANAADNLENKDNKNTDNNKDNNNKDTASVGDNKDTGVNEKKPDNNTVSDNTVSNNTVSNNTASGNSASENLASDSEANNTEINNTVSENVASNNSTTGTSSNDEKEDVKKEDGKKEDGKKEDKSTGGNAVTDVAENANVVSVMVYAGDGSFIVAKRAYEAGLVDSAAEYDMYLCQNGYDKRLTVGDHKIPVGSSPEEIAKILTSATR